MPATTHRKVKTAMIRARTEPKLKRKVEEILLSLGLSPTEAITLFYHQIALQNGLPFEIKIPNPVTLKVFKDTDREKNILRAKNSKDLFKKLGI